MGDFVAKDGVVNGKARATGLVPGRCFSSVVYQVGICGRGGMPHSGCKKILVVQGSFIETVLREKRDAGIALGERLRIESSFGGEAVLGLRTNVLECDNG